MNAWSLHSSIWLRTVIILLAVHLSCSLCCPQPNPWRILHGTQSFDPGDIDVDHAHPDIVYSTGLFFRSAFTSSAALLRSADRGAHWDSLDICGSVFGPIRVAPQHSQVLFTSVDGFTIRPGDYATIRSTDGGQTWSELFGWSSGPSAIGFDPSDPNTVYISPGRGVYRSTDLGASWSPLDSVPDGLTADLAVAATNESVTYVVYLNGAIARCTDAGDSWQYHTIQPASGIPYAVHLCVSPAAANVLYLGVCTTSDTNFYGVYKSTDGGLSWERKNNGLEGMNLCVNALKINPKNPEELILGTGTLSSQQSMLLHSTDGGDSWTPFGDGLPVVGSVHAIAIDALNNRMYVGVMTSTDSSGIYAADLVTEVTERTFPERLLLSQNYPNPFNPSTTIHFELPHAGQARLTLFNLLGQPVMVVVDEKKPAGVYDVKVNAGKLSSGVYFYRLTAGEFVQTRRMVLMK